MLSALGLILFGYLAGSLASALVVARILGLPDPRGVGSGNPGATNMLRVGGRAAAAITLGGDVLKGVLPVVVAKLAAISPVATAAAGFAAFLGHLYPVFFGFRGGKGVATAFGAVCALAWPVALAMLITWGAVAALFRYASLAALVTAALAPLYMALLAPQPPYIACVGAMALLLIWRHRANIRRLRTGTESKIRTRSREPG